MKQNQATQKFMTLSSKKAVTYLLHSKPQDFKDVISNCHTIKYPAILAELKRRVHILD